MNWRGISYAPYFAGWFLTWPIIGYMGAQGHTGLVGFLAIPVLLLVRPKSIPPYVIAFAAFIGWVVAVSFWSSDGKSFVSGSFGQGSFTMDMVGARVSLTALACAAVLLAARFVRSGTGGRSLAVIRTVGFVQMVGVLVTAIWMQPIIDLIISHGQSDQNSMTQNLLRNANSFLLLLPFLLVWSWTKAQGGLRKGLVLAGGLAVFAAFALTGTQTAMFGTGFMLLAMGLIHRFPISGFRVLTGGLAAYVVTAPVILSNSLAQLRTWGVPLPGSFMSRSYSWDLVGQKVAEKPLFGHGLEASHNWVDTYADHPDWLAHVVAAGADEAAWSVYRVTPTHPHNMALQIWAETGAIGALLFAFALIGFGWRLRPPCEWSTVTRYSAAGLFGVVTAIFSFSYSMWNEAFWASVSVAAAIILLQARRDGVR